VLSRIRHYVASCNDLCSAPYQSSTIHRDPFLWWSTIIRSSDCNDDYFDLTLSVLISQFSFYFDSSQDKCVRSSLHDDYFTTSYNPTTQSIDKFYCTVYYTTLICYLQGWHCDVYYTVASSIFIYLHSILYDIIDDDYYTTSYLLWIIWVHMICIYKSMSIVFWFKSSQVKCDGSSLHGADFTTSSSPATWPKLSTSVTIRSTIWIWFVLSFCLPTPYSIRSYSWQLLYYIVSIAIMIQVISIPCLLRILW